MTTRLYSNIQRNLFEIQSIGHAGEPAMTLGMYYDSTAHSMAV